MGVYGNFLSSFPELTRRIQFRDGRKIPAVYVDTQHADVFRQSTGGRSSYVMDMNNTGKMYVSTRYARSIKEGDLFVHPEYNYEMKVVGRIPYNLPAGYEVFNVERVSGADSTQTKDLDVKEAYFA